MGLGPSELSFTVFEPQQLPEAVHPRWAVLGRSNVGKSSFLNALLHPFELFRTGKAPGVTRGLIGCHVHLGKGEKAILELVDLPGFGFAKVDQATQAKWNILAQTLREKSIPEALLWVWLVDPTRSPDQEERNLRAWIGTEPYIFIFTKADKVKNSERARAIQAWSKIADGAVEAPYWVSSLKGEGFDAIFKSARSYLRNSHEHLASG